MDVIALHQAGFPNTVATLGTAFTQRQMEQLWLLAPEPVICFDGDRAGEAAAARAIDRMLPVLHEGHSFRFAFLPEGFDPDDLVRQSGPAALSACLEGARPLIDVLWRRECASAALDTPERRAALEGRLDQLLETIANARVREHYRREIRSRLFALWRETGRGSGRKTNLPAHRPDAGRAPVRPLPSAHGFAITIVLALAHHPWLLERFAEEVGKLDIGQKQLAGLLAALTDAIFRHHGISGERLAEEMRKTPHGALLDKLDRSSAFKRLAFLQSDMPAPEVEEHFAELLFRWTTLKALDREVQEVALDLSEYSEEDYEHFVLLQRQVANAGLRHAADDAGDRESAKRFQETVARLKAGNVAAQKGRRPERRPDRQ